LYNLLSDQLEVKPLGPSTVALPDINLFALSPAVTLVITACVLLLLVVALPRLQGAVYAFVTLLGIGVAVALTIAQLSGSPSTTFGGFWRADGFSAFFTLTVLLAAALGVCISDDWLRLHRVGQPEYYAILLCSATGAIVCASAGELATLFLGIELMSVPTYVLTGFAKRERVSNEGAMKYFLLGAFSTAILLYGMTWMFGLTGSTTYAGIAQFVAGGGGESRAAILLAMLLMIAGLSFKIAAVPFHMWTPDAYQGAPTVVTAFMSVAVKAGAFAALTRLMTEAMPGLAADWRPVLIALAILSMLLGNVAAIVQYDVKRMLAYSSVGHTGFMLVGLGVWSPDNRLGAASVLFYSFAYVFMNLGAFGVLAWIENHGGGTTLDHMEGLFSKAPWAAAALAVFLLGLMGFPLTVGLPAKVFVFQAATEGGLTWLAVLGLVLSAVAAVYYLRVMVRMFMYEPKLALASPEQPLMVFGLTVAAVATVLLGVLFSPILELAQRAVGG
jgi:NADH-quinone oxidoreductase subunit N